MNSYAMCYVMLFIMIEQVMLSGVLLLLKEPMNFISM